MRRILACAVIVATLVLGGGCAGTQTKAEPAGATSASATPTPTPSPTKVVAQEYSSLTDLRDAAITALFSCPVWEQTDELTNAAESGSCSDSDVFTTYASETSRDAQVAQAKANNDMLEEAGIEGSTALVGPNWIITGDDAEIRKLQKGLGGQIAR